MTRFIQHTLLILLVFAASTSDLLAKSRTAELMEEVQALKQGQVQMQKDLDEIKKLLQKGARAVPGQQAFKPTDIELGDVAQKGESTAPVTLVEYSDYHCPYCKRHATTVLPRLQKAYIDTGKLRFVMREFPIPNLHPRAKAASVAVLCGGEQGDYWGMHDAVFGNQKARTDEDFKAMAASAGLDEAAFNACLSSGRFDDRISAEQAEGRKLGITGTPSFVLGLTDPDNPDIVHLSKFIRGAQSFEAFSAAIDELLEQAEEAE